MYILIVSIQIISFYLIFLTMTNLKFGISEAIWYGLGTLIAGWSATAVLGVWGAGVIGVYFIGISTFKRRFKLIWWDWFCAVYSLLMNTFIGYLTWDLCAGLVSMFFSKVVLSTEYIEYLVNALMPVLINGAVVYSIKRWLKKKNISQEFLMERRVIIIPLLLMIGIVLYLYPIISFGNRYGGLADSQNIVLTGLWFIFGCVLVYLAIRYAWLISQRMQEMRKKQITDLLEYSVHIERLYDELRGFRHDYANILATLEYGIYKNDIEEVRTAYEKVVKPSGIKVSDSKYSFANLGQIEVMEVKSLLSAKLIMAEHRKLSISLEIADQITNVYMDLIAFIRIISILLDNAIEAAEETEEKSLYLAIYEDSEQQIFDIQNSTAEQRDINLIERKGVTTKGASRGTGLFNVREILRQQRHVTLSTEQDEGVFRQKVIIQKAIRQV